jgi:hypothetical protein
VIFSWVAGSEALRRPGITRNWVVDDSDPATFNGFTTSRLVFEPDFFFGVIARAEKGRLIKPEPLSRAYAGP